jgi:hypothetical protein
MEKKEETAAKAGNADFGGYACRWCGRFDADGVTWISSCVFQEFIGLMDHLIRDHMEFDRLWEQQKDAFSLGEPQILRVAPLGSVPIPEAKQFLTAVSDWLKPALESIPGLESTTDSSMLVAEQLVSDVRKLSEEVREQREYLLENEQALRDTAMDPKWPRRAGDNIIVFVAESMAGARWGYKPTSSREFIRQHRRKTTRDGSSRKAGKWWEETS